MRCSAHVSVRIHRLDPAVALPRYETGGAAGFDLAAREDTVVPAGAVALVPTGLVIQVPRGPLPRHLRAQQHAAQARPDGRQRRRRRSTRTTAAPTDEIKIQVLNFTQAPVTSTRAIASRRACCLPVTRAEWQETDGDSARAVRAAASARRDSASVLCQAPSARLSSQRAWRTCVALAAYTDATQQRR